MSFRSAIPVILAVSLLLVLPVNWAAAATGDGFDVASYRGKVLVLDFWASWCVPCRRSFPWLNSMHEKYADKGLVIVGVNLDQEPGEAARFLEKYPARFRIHYDREGLLAEKYDVQGMPTSFVIGRDGEIEAEHRGFKVKRQGEYEAAIVAALQKEIVQ